MEFSSERAHLYGEGDPNHEDTILQTITNKRREDVAAAKADVSMDQLRTQTADFDQVGGNVLFAKSERQRCPRAGRKDISA